MHVTAVAPTRNFDAVVCCQVANYSSLVSALEGDDQRIVLHAIRSSLTSVFVDMCGVLDTFQVPEIRTGTMVLFFGFGGAIAKADRKASTAGELHTDRDYPASQAAEACLEITRTDEWRKRLASTLQADGVTS